MENYSLYNQLVHSKDPAFLEKHARSDDTEAHFFVVENEHTHPDTLDHLARTHAKIRKNENSSTIINKIAQNNNTREDTIRHLIENSHNGVHGVHGTIATYSNNPKILRLSYNHVVTHDGNSPLLRSYFAMNSSTPTDVLEHISEHIKNNSIKNNSDYYQPDTLGLLINHNNTSEKVLRNAYAADKRRSGFLLKSKLVQHKKFPSDLLDEIAQQRNDFNTEITKNPNTALSTLEHIKKQHISQQDKLSHDIIKNVYTHPNYPLNDEAKDFFRKNDKKSMLSLLKR